MLEKSRILLILAIASMAVVGTTVLALLSTSRTISSTGNVKAVKVGVYKDVNCSQAVTTIDWGTLTPGSSANSTVYIRNEGTVTLVLTRTVGNWNPSPASGNFTVGWNREGSAVGAGATIQATLNLTVSQSISGVSSFSFDITITGTEIP
jgi:hypothetical protein